jgi:hypothetical protein
MYVLAGSVDCELGGVCTQPPHPGSTELAEVQPLSLEGRGEQDKTERVVRENSHHPRSSFSPRPLRERGRG